MKIIPVGLHEITQGTKILSEAPSRKKAHKSTNVEGAFDRIALNEAAVVCGGCGELQKAMGFECGFCSNYER